MFKQIRQLIFPIFFITIFTLFPLIFTFDETSNPWPTDNNSGRSNEIIQSKSFIWPFFDSDNDIDDLKEFQIVSYDPTRISIFGEAIQSLIEYHRIGGIYQQLSVSQIVDKFQRNATVYPISESIQVGFASPPTGSVPFNPGNFQNDPATKFFYANYDSYNKVVIPQSLINNGHFAATGPFVALPRFILKDDLEVKLSAQSVESMFLAHAQSYFGFDFQRITQRDPNNLKPKKVRRVLEGYWKENRINQDAYSKLRKDLFENPSVVKVTGCKYSFEPGTVKIYYDLNTDLFGIVNEKNNKFIIGGVASLCDFIDVYYFKWLGVQKTFNSSTPVDDSPVSEAAYNAYDKLRDRGLPKNYNPIKWWESTQKMLEKEFLQSINKTSYWYDNLKITADATDLETAKFEAFSLLQLEAEKYLIGVFRPDKANNPREKDLDTDGRFQNFNPNLIPFCRPTIVDIKALIDPEVLVASKYQTSVTGGRMLEQQITDVVNSVKSQQIRSTVKFNETVLHVINLFKVRPIDRPMVMATFEAKAIQNKIDLDCVIFLNTKDDSIY